MRRDLDRTGKRAGFTLLEVILAMSLSFFLLIALYQAIQMQAQYSDFAAAEMRQSQIARTLLGRLAAEIRSIEPLVPRGPRPPVVSQAIAEDSQGAVEETASLPLATAESESPIQDFRPDPVSFFYDGAPAAQALLAYGEGETSASDMFASPFESAEEDEVAVNTAPERFTLLGTSNRLLLRYRQEDVGSSVVEQFHTDPLAAEQMAGTGADSRVSAAGNLRQVLYLLRPNPEARELTPVAPESEESELPTYQGLIRQEIKRPWALEAMVEAELQLEPFFATDEEPAESPGLTLASMPKTTEAPGDEMPPSQYVQTKVMAEEIKAIRFRYYDGAMWLDRWERGDQLPAALEIAVSFDDWIEGEETLSVETPSLDGELETGEPAEGEPTFPYRLVVVLPQSGVVIRPSLESMDGSASPTELEETRGESQP